ncbi:hypothetical protein P2318_18525 [Myxococcaceae bacterium GXIMD 01537]
MHRRRLGWLVAAGVLFALAAWLMFTGSGDEPAPEAPKVDFPRRMRPEERARAERRRTWVMPAAPDAGTTAQGPQRPRDPLIAALPRGKTKMAVVVEANALRYSPIGELLLQCLMRDGGKELEQFKQASGVDPLQDIDRIALSDGSFILSGNFEKAKIKDILGERTSFDYGDGARIYEPGPMNVAGPDGGTLRGRSEATFGTWNNEMLIVGKSPDDIKQVIDRMEGRGPDEPPVLSESSTYGELYGVMGLEALLPMIPPDQADLAKRLREIGDTVELHMDARSDVAMVAELKGTDEQKVSDLAKTLGAALAMGRLQAQAEGNKDVAQLLDFARVQPDGSQFKLELAVPLSVLQERLAWCREAPKPEEAREQREEASKPEQPEAQEPVQAEAQ